ncbi:MAG: hypothetical protein IFK92_07115 [Acidobacteria bacterium]|nr:hypothetical protein [Candidatus Sulfomarinibacter kjeldsenii]
MRKSLFDGFDISQHGLRPNEVGTSLLQHLVLLLQSHQLLLESSLCKLLFTGAARTTRHEPEHN